MTAGYADFQAPTQWRTAADVSQFQVSFPAGNNTFGPFLLGNFGSLFIQASAGVNPTFVQITFFDDLAGSNATQVLTWSLAPFTSMGVGIPALGNYYKIVYNNDGPGAETGTLYVYQTNLANTRPYYTALNTAGPLISNSQSIGAGAQVSTAATQIYGGTVYFSVANSTTSKWHALFQAYNDSSSSFVQFAAVDGSLGELRKVIPLAVPSALLQVTMTNDDAAAHSFQYSIVPAGL